MSRNYLQFSANCQHCPKISRFSRLCVKKSLCSEYNSILSPNFFPRLLSHSAFTGPPFYTLLITKFRIILKMPLSNSNKAGAPGFNGLQDDWSSTEDSSVQSTNNLANTAAQAARVGEFSNLLEQFQHTAPDSMPLLNQALHLMFASSKSESWEAMSSSLPDLFSDDERAGLVERKTVQVSELAANACHSVSRLRRNLLLETKTLFRLNKSTVLGGVDFEKEVNDFETSLAAITLAIQAFDSKLTKYNRARFSQTSSSSDSPDQPDLNRAIGTNSSPLAPSSFIPEPASVAGTSMTGMSSPIVSPLGHGRGMPIQPQQPASSSGSGPMGRGRNQLTDSSSPDPRLNWSSSNDK